MITIDVLTCDDLPAAEALFQRRFAAQRQAVPAVPETLAAPGAAADALRGMVLAGRGLAAREGAALAGYLAWHVVGHFRGTRQTAAYCPEVGHAGATPEVYAALYAAAAARWAEAGCGTHALTTLAVDEALHRLLYTRGFGLAVVDAARWAEPLAAAPASAGVRVRQATADDAAALVTLNAALCAHLQQPHIGMPRHEPQDAAGQAAFLARGANAVFIAESQGSAAGYLRFEAPCTSAAVSSRGSDAVGISGAFVWPEARRRGVAERLLAYGLGYYRERGVRRCTVDWESFNPEAQAFWPRHFGATCHSLIRHVESAL